MTEVCGKGANAMLADTSKVRKPFPSLGSTEAIQNLMSDQEWRPSQL